MIFSRKSVEGILGGMKGSDKPGLVEAGFGGGPRGLFLSNGDAGSWELDTRRNARLESARQSNQQPQVCAGADARLFRHKSDCMLVWPDRS